MIATFSSPKNGGWCWPSEQTIGALAGLTEKGVRAGTEELAEVLTNFKIARELTPRGRYHKRYWFGGIGEPEKGRYFFFMRSVLDGGNWRLLSGTGKTLYPVMRTFSFLDYGADEDQLELTMRDYDTCTAEPEVMMDFSGITRNSYPAALKSLTGCNLIEADGTDDEGRQRWKVWAVPERHFKREYLNKQLAGMSKTTG